MTLSRESRKAITDALSSLKRPVTVTAFSQSIETDECREARSIAEFLAETSLKVSVETADFVANGTLVRKFGIELIPAISVSSREGACFRFEGVPSGFIFESLIDALKAASAQPEPLPKPFSWLSGLDRDLRISVFASPTCPEGPAMIAMAIKLAFASKGVIARAVNVLDFPHLAVRYGVDALPSVFAAENGKFPAVAKGPVTEAEFLERLKAIAVG
jgi:alkyl hydroperoxide reductase subunit AhpF